MTLLDEYQALPREPRYQDDFTTADDAYPAKLERREAVIRLLAKALREAESALPHVLSERRRILADQFGPLLSAVERDFGEKANG